jgi:nucleoside-diphosphate-sugar epimerase
VTAVRVAVLGASGVAGRAFVPRGRAAGLELRVDRVDVLDRSALRAHVAGCDAVVNLATSIPRPGGRGSWAANDRIRREGTAHVLAASVEAGVGVVVQQSVAMLHAGGSRPSVETDPIHGEGVLASAVEMEALVRAAPVDGRLVRGGLFHGPGTGSEEAWLAQVREPGFRSAADVWVSLVHVEDYADALLAVLLRSEPRATYLACDDEPLRWSELHARVARWAGLPPPLAGGSTRMPSFRCSSARLRALSWTPAHPTLDLSGLDPFAGTSPRDGRSR